MNPNTTLFYLFGRQNIFPYEFSIASIDGAKTSVISYHPNGCYPNVRTVFPADVDFIQHYPFVGCLAYDTVYGKNFSSETIYADYFLDIN